MKKFVALLLSVFCSLGGMAAIDLEIPSPCFPLDVVRADQLQKDEQYFLSSLQGLFNVENGENCSSENSTHFGTIYIEDRTIEGLYNWIETYDLEHSHLSFDELVEKYRTRISCTIVYDPDYLETVNLATYLASKKRCVLSSPNLKDRLLELLPGLRVNTGLVGRYQNRYQVLDRFLQEVQSEELPPKILFSLKKETTHRSREIPFLLGGAPVQWFQFKKKEPNGDIVFDQREWSVAQRMRTHLADTANTWGFYQWEVEGVKRFSQLNMGTLVGNSFSNYSFWKGFNKAAPTTSVVAVESETSAKIDSQKIPLLLVVSDGDNMGYVQHLLKKIFDGRQTPTQHALNWSIASALSGVAPEMLKHFQGKRQSNESFVTGFGGFAYNYMEQWTDNQLLSAHLKKTFSKMKEASLGYMSFNFSYENRNQPLPENVSQALLENYSSDIRGLVHHAGLSPAGTKEAYFDKSGYIVSPTIKTIRKHTNSQGEIVISAEEHFREALLELKEQIRLNPNRLHYYSFLMHAWRHEHDYIYKVLDEFSDTFQSLTADDFFSSLKKRLSSN